ncbi:uncharacterized protein F4807DRAFT_410925 [Annulohypoxylon truncatum]|uniref:uncharacterized protein n=1 Tax=Annulohypoxylon truncatum TaxID=327061 RepID=UPI002007D45A|nr:uncharacterized protein F4807DRAFT_410925 [Annulohypoxylon truncatum]KAI1213390.1 hypothetical protein F4807DRAFT_410925 [Annulohypoxylon truncatum]
MMKTYSLVTKALLGIAPQINIALFGGNDSSAAEPAMSNDTLANSIGSVLATPTANISDLGLTPTIGFTATQVVMDIVQSSEDTTSSEQLVDSVPPRITIDTVIAAVRPQKITEVDSKASTTAPAAPSIASDITILASVTSTD